MSRREVIVEVLTPDEICQELYGSVKAELVWEVAKEARSVRSRAAHRRLHSGGRRSHFVPGPTREALTVPKFRKFVEGGSNADSSRPER